MDDGEVAVSESASRRFETSTVALMKTVAEWHACVLNALSENVYIDPQIEFEMGVTNEMLGEFLTRGIKTIKIKIVDSFEKNDIGHLQGDPTRDEIDPEALKGYALRDALREWDTATETFGVECTSQGAREAVNAVSAELSRAEILWLQVHAKMDVHGLVVEPQQAPLFYSGQKVGTDRSAAGIAPSTELSK